MNKNRKQWIEAAKIIAADPKAQVKCPVCGKAELVVWDEHWEQDPSRWERHMRCPECGASNSILMRRNSDGD